MLSQAPTCPEDCSWILLTDVLEEKQKKVGFVVRQQFGAGF